MIWENLWKCLAYFARKLCFLTRVGFQKYLGCGWILPYIFNVVNFNAIFMTKCKLQSSNGHWGTSTHKYFDQNWSWINILAKFGLLLVGHPGKPQNASKLRLGLNIFCDPFQFHSRYMQDVGCSLREKLQSMQCQNRCLMTPASIWSLKQIRACLVMEGKAYDVLRRVLAIASLPQRAQWVPDPRLRLRCRPWWHEWYALSLSHSAIAEW